VAQPGAVLGAELRRPLLGGERTSFRRPSDPLRDLHELHAAQRSLERKPRRQGDRRRLGCFGPAQSADRAELPRHRDRKSQESPEFRSNAERSLGHQKLLDHRVCERFLNVPARIVSTRRTARPRRNFFLPLPACVRSVGLLRRYQCPLRLIGENPERRHVTALGGNVVDTSTRFAGRPSAPKPVRLTIDSNTVVPSLMRSRLSALKA